MMNQSIQFPDRESRDDSQQCIIFPVMINGFLSDCYVSGQYLQSRYGTDVDEDMLALFRRNRWDLEEEFAEFIEKDGAEEPPYRLPCDR